TLSWDFVSLAPFESKEIYVTFNLNAPTDNPPLESGSILNYTASIIGNLEDETPLDNTFVFNQEVLNSFDPNDKRCLEGNTIPLNKVGDYVHYMIRFENTGTANAQNVVVVDNLDVSKFDVSSFQALNGSHPFVTKISNSNKVEFIFENINLPFDDASNDGYIVFKIKTKNNLQLNDTFSNTASIYFDYNFPIVTEPAITVVSQALGLAEVDGVFVSIVPNPTQDVLTITTKNEISSVMIFDTNGRIIQTKILNNELETQLDLTSYQQGVYYVKVITKEGFGIKKIVKNNK
ncbi:MAG TPA: T9SS type A sorting domain-containing protein, partial [Flavobacterium sp.]|nr:T9SS type A sorting domain-containing protein [Flavobacterium sp.]